MTSVYDNTTVPGGATQALGVGETSTNVKVANGTQIVGSGALTTGTLLTNTNLTNDLFLNYPVKATQIVSAGGSAVGTLVTAGFATSAVSATTVYTGTATQSVQGGGQVSGTVLTGLASVGEGTLSSLYVYTLSVASATQTLLSGAVATDETINHDSVVTVSGGAQLNGATLSGVVHNWTLFQGSHDGFLNYTSYGQADILTGATASDLTINSYGLVEVAAGANVSDVTLNGGILELQAGATTPTDLNFASGIIQIDDLAYKSGLTTVTLQNGNDLVVTNGTDTRTIELQTVASSLVLRLQAAATGTGTDIVLGNVTVPCFCPGTLIATDTGDRPVETLKIGDLLLTAAGTLRPLRWIGRRSYGALFARGNRDIMPVCIARGALGHDLPRRDLWVSPMHAMVVDGALIPALHLVNGRSIRQHEIADSVSYLHLELEDHDILLAEGAPTESFIDDNSRSMFHNAHEYDALYPDAPSRPARFCLPRLEDGPRLLAIHARLAALTDDCGPWSCTLDVVGPNTLEGWVRGVSSPSSIEILIDGVVVGTCRADRRRPDVAAHYGLAETCGFVFGLPRGMRGLTAARVSVRPLAQINHQHAA